MNTSAYVFSLIIKRLKITALKYKVGSTQIDTNEYRFKNSFADVLNNWLKLQILGKIKSQKSYAHLSKF